tara:strand:- start:670 stop:951 length:282 start_codon:yes stop_codon:yes gene_type:complete
VRNEHPAGDPTLILVFGILGLMVCQLFGVAAWVMGNGHRRRSRELGVEPDGAATAGWICGIISSCMLILFVLGCCMYFVVVALMIGGAAAGGA